MKNKINMVKYVLIQFTYKYTYIYHFSGMIVSSGLLPISIGGYILGLTCITSC
jgi:hypothetical protein